MKRTRQWNAEHDWNKCRVRDAEDVIIFYFVGHYFCFISWFLKALFSFSCRIITSLLCCSFLGGLFGRRFLRRFLGSRLFRLFSCGLFSCWFLCWRFFSWRLWGTSLLPTCCKFAVPLFNETEENVWMLPAQIYMTYMSYINISIYADRRGYTDQTLRSAISVLVCFTLCWIPYHIKLTRVPQMGKP